MNGTYDRPRKSFARVAGGALGLALLAQLLAVGGVGAAEPCGQEQQVDSLHVTVETDRGSYRVGESVRLDVTVKRPQQQLAGTRLPAADVPVSVGISVGDVLLYGSGRTDEKGHAEVTVKVKRYTPKGSADVSALASKEYTTGHCPMVRESGWTAVKRLFSVKR